MTFYCSSACVARDSMIHAGPECHALVELDAFGVEGDSQAMRLALRLVSAYYLLRHKFHIKMREKQRASRMQKNLLAPINFLFLLQRIISSINLHDAYDFLLYRPVWLRKKKPAMTTVKEALAQLLL